MSLFECQGKQSIPESKMKLKKQKSGIRTTELKSYFEAKRFMTIARNEMSETLEKLFIGFQGLKERVETLENQNRQLKERILKLQFEWDIGQKLKYQQKTPQKKTKRNNQKKSVGFREELELHKTEENVREKDALIIIDKETPTQSNKQSSKYKRVQKIGGKIDMMEDSDVKSSCYSGPRSTNSQNKWDVERLSQLLQTSENSCGWISALDLLSKSQWIKGIELTQEFDDDLVQVLSQKRGCNYARAIQIIEKWSKENGGNINDLGQLQDPWVILNMIQLMLINVHSGSKEGLMPLLECTCNTTGKLKVYCNLEYSLRKKQNKYIMRSKACSGCNGLFKSKIKQLPVQFAVRVLDDGSKQNVLNRNEDLRFKDYRISGLIQFKSQKKHFRCIKMVGKNFTKILDGESQRFEKELEKRDQYVKQKGWVNYISLYKHFSSDSFKKGNQQGRYITPPEISKQVLGGTDLRVNETNLRALLWNVQSGKHLQAIRGIIRETKADIVLLNELRKQKQVRGFSGIHSKAAQGRNSKINCSLFVKEQFSFHVLRNVVDYLFVKIEISSTKSIFVWLIYSNCNHEASQSRQRVRQLFEEDYTALIRKLGYLPEIVVAGDLNETVNEIRKKAEDGQYFESVLLDLYKSNM